VSHSQTSEAEVPEISSRIEEALRDRTDLHTIIVYGSAASGDLRSGAAFASDVDLVDLREAHGLLLTQILTKGRDVRKDNPSFVAEKAIEMYDYQRFFEPSIREARRRRIERLTGASHGSRTD